MLWGMDDPMSTDGPRLLKKEQKTRRGVVTVLSYIYDAFDARHYDLFMRTWGEYITTGSARSLTEAHFRNLYESNPSGKSVIAVAEQEGDWVGSISAIPTSILCTDGGRKKALQVSDFMVDPLWQGQGLGGKLVQQLTEHLCDFHLPIYTFPNIRSVGVFLKQGYLELRSIPAVVFPLLPTGLFSRSAFHPGRRGRNVSIEEACQTADGLIALPRSNVVIEKSGTYLQWRYGQIRDRRDYCFTLVDPAKDNPPTLVVWCRFLFRKIPVQVILDVLSEEDAIPPFSEVAWAGMKEGAIFGVNNVERAAGTSLPLLAVQVPLRYDPRPARLLVPPNDKLSKTLFAACRFTTGDWMGF
jgi:GNAT superfamily N-acetyltransferase